MQQDKPVLIAGGGIGGLAAALGLAQKGFKVIVLERAPVLGEIGAGIQLGPNAFHAFDALGVGDTARAMAVYIDQLRLMDALTAEPIATIPLASRTEMSVKVPPMSTPTRSGETSVVSLFCMRPPDVRSCVSVNCFTFMVSDRRTICKESAGKGGVRRRDGLRRRREPADCGAAGRLGWWCECSRGAGPQCGQSGGG